MSDHNQAGNVGVKATRLCCWATHKPKLAWLQAGDLGPVQEFGALFDSVKFRKGLQLNFTSDKNGSLITQVDEQQVFPLHAPLLSLKSNVPTPNKHLV